MRLSGYTLGNCRGLLWKNEKSSPANYLAWIFNNSTESASTKDALRAISEGLTTTSGRSRQQSLDTMANDIESRINTANAISSKTEDLISSMARDAREIRSQSVLMCALSYSDMKRREREISLAHVDTFLWIFDGLDLDTCGSDEETPRHDTKFDDEMTEFKIEHVETMIRETGSTGTEATAPADPNITDDNIALRNSVDAESDVEIYDESSSEDENCYGSKPTDSRSNDDMADGDKRSEVPKSVSGRNAPSNASSSPKPVDLDKVWKVPQRHTKDTEFVSWLRSGSGTYWITGKPGSGKSTLMKFVHTHAITAQALQEWTGAEVRLITASHYFWSAGSDLQKSQEGLVRSILEQITAQCPRILESVCPERFHGHVGSSDKSWSVGELWDILTRSVMCREALRGSIKFVFFIDGLDECDDDHDEILGRIKMLTALPHAKLCASSREWPVFSRHFMPNATVPVVKIHVHEYTYNDIYQYTKAKLDGERRPAHFAPTIPERHALVKEVVDRAQGVFLWVKLVCKTLVRGYDNDDSWSTLMRRLKSLPTDLEPYFRKMFDDIDPIYIDDFGMLIAAMNIGSGWGHVQYLHVEMFGDFCQGRPDWTENSAVGDDQSLTVPQIKARGADLIEVRENELGYIHKSVYDFLREKSLSDQIERITSRNSFNPFLYWARQHIRQYYRQNPRYSLDGIKLVGSIFSNLLTYELIHKATCETFLDSLDSVLCGRETGYIEWKRGTTLAKALETGLEIYTSLVLSRQGTELPEFLFRKKPPSRSPFHRYFLAITPGSPRDVRATPIAFLLAVRCLVVQGAGYNLAPYWIRPHKGMLELLLPFGLPTMEPVDNHPHIGMDNTWQFFLKYVRHSTRCDSMVVHEEMRFHIMVRIIEEADICDHFFDKRTRFPLERLDRYEVRQLWELATEALRLRRRRHFGSGWLSFPTVTHWRCYLQGLLSIAYLATLAPPTTPGDRDTEEAIAKWIFDSSSSNYWKHRAIPKVPTTIPPWRSHLPQQLDSFCKLLWPAVWLSAASGLWISLMTFLPKWIPRHEEAYGTALHMVQSMRHRRHGYATWVLTTHVIIWVASVGACIYRRRTAYLAWFHKEQATQDAMGRERLRMKHVWTSTLDSGTGPDALRREKAREADVVKMAAETRVRKLAIPYFVSFLVLWLIFG